MDGERGGEDADLEVHVLDVLPPHIHGREAAEQTPGHTDEPMGRGGDHGPAVGEREQPPLETWPRGTLPGTGAPGRGRGPWPSSRRPRSRNQGNHRFPPSVHSVRAKSWTSVVADGMSPRRLRQTAGLSIYMCGGNEPISVRRPPQIRVAGLPDARDHDRRRSPIDKTKGPAGNFPAGPDNQATTRRLGRTTAYVTRAYAAPSGWSSSAGTGTHSVPARRPDRTSPTSVTNRSANASSSRMRPRSVVVLIFASSSERTPANREAGA